MPVSMSWLMLGLGFDRKLLVAMNDERRERRAMKQKVCISSSDVCHV